MADRSGQKWERPLRPRNWIGKLTDSLRQQKQRRTLSHDAALGRRGEDLAHRYLQRAGFQVVARNYRPGPDSEIDLVARDGNITVFIEVKSRATAEFGDPGRAIDGEKQKHIVRAAHSWATRAGTGWDRVRFDVISIVFTEPPSIRHDRDAFFAGRAR